MKKKNKDLPDYLQEIGCELLDTKNEWETARFIANDIHCVIYHNAKGMNSFSNETSKKLYEGWLSGKKIKLPNIKRKSIHKLMREKLIKRDGYSCFYTGRIMSKEEMTVEHLIPVCRGGKNILENLVLCLKEENEKMADKDLVSKIKYRDEVRKCSIL